MYLPPLAEILEGLQRALQRSVIPALDDPYARTIAMRVCGELGTLAGRLVDVRRWCELENAEARLALQSALDALAPADGEASALADLRATVAAALAREFPSDQPDRSEQSLAAEGQVLGGAIETAILRLHELQRLQPADASLAQAREALRAVIRAQAVRRDPGLDAAQIQHRN
ncbi:MAG: hypothetical protein IT304_09065 [Dehalococcoidia bacterium]|nr:hypothetical protein [Dehalococcoidia bacterium]